MSLYARLQRHRALARQRLAYDDLCRRHPLKYLFLEVTRRCNLACRYCGSSCGPKEREDELTAQQWVDVIRQVATDFEPHSVMVAVTGGEPLVKDGIFGIFAELRRQGFPYGMVSNGQLLDRTVADELVRVGIGSISLSMDAPPDLNDKLRGKGSSRGVLEAVANLRAAGYKGTLEIISTITKPAVARLDEMRKLVSKLRIPLWRVAPVMPIGRAAKQTDLIPDEVDVRAILEFVREARQDAQLPRPEFSEEGFLGNRFEGMVRPYLCQCRAGITIAGVGATGRIGACPELSSAFDQGHIGQDRLAAVWKERYQVFRDRSWTRRGACGACQQFKDCNGGALHLYDGPDSEFLRCLYLMCKASDGKPIPRPA